MVCLLRPTHIPFFFLFSFFVMPTPVLKGLIMGGLETDSSDPAIKLSCAFMEERLESLGQATLASRFAGG